MHSRIHLGFSIHFFRDFSYYAWKKALAETPLYVRTVQFSENSKGETGAQFS